MAVSGGQDWNTSLIEKSLPFPQVSSSHWSIISLPSNITTPVWSPLVLPPPPQYHLSPAESPPFKIISPSCSLAPPPSSLFSPLWYHPFHQVPSFPRVFFLPSVTCLFPPVASPHVSFSPLQYPLPPLQYHSYPIKGKYLTHWSAGILSSSHLQHSSRICQLIHGSHSWKPEETG